MPARQPLRKLVSFLLDALAPDACASCGESPGQREAFCARCGAAIAPATTWSLGAGLEGRAASAYSGPMKTAIRALKYQDRADLAGPLGRWAAGRLGVTAGVVLVPVPLHPARVVERGYNQSVLLARALADSAGVAVAPSSLERRRRGGAQARLARPERLGNAAGAYRSVGRLDGRVWLVDDVVTTGATAVDCARALREAGTDVRGILCLARAEAAPEAPR